MAIFIQYLLMGFIIYMLTKAFAPQGQARKEAGSQWASPFANTSSFIAMEYFMLVNNRTLRVFIEHEYICGIKVGSYIASQGAYMAKAGKDPEFYANEFYEREYVGMKIGSKEMLTKDKANFLIKKSAIQDITFHKFKWGMLGVPYSGRIVLHLKSGSKKELILLGEQDQEELRNKILGV